MTTEDRKFLFGLALFLAGIYLSYKDPMGVVITGILMVFIGGMYIIKSL